MLRGPGVMDLTGAVLHLGAHVGLRVFGTVDGLVAGNGGTPGSPVLGTDDGRARVVE